jgi:methylmalonyl-CoA mutase
MNAAIDQQCEYYIKENSLEKEVEVKINAIYSKKGEGPHYQGDLPVGNNGLD